MAYDKVIDSSALDANLASIAEAIRTKGGTTDQLVFPAGFISAIEAIEAGGSSEPFSKIITGSYTPATNETSITFLPEENIKLRYFILQDSNYEKPNTVAKQIRNICVFRGSAQLSRVSYAANSYWTMPNCLETATNDEIVVFPSNSTTTLFIGAGVTYNWIAVYTE